MWTLDRAGRQEVSSNRRLPAGCRSIEDAKARPCCRAFGFGHQCSTPRKYVGEPPRHSIRKQPLRSNSTSNGWLLEKGGEGQRSRSTYEGGGRSLRGRAPAWRFLLPAPLTGLAGGGHEMFTLSCTIAWAPLELATVHNAIHGFLGVRDLPLLPLLRQRAAASQRRAQARIPKTTANMIQNFTFIIVSPAQSSSYRNHLVKIGSQLESCGCHS